MPNDETILESIPNGVLGLVPTTSCKELADKVDEYLTTWRKNRVHQHSNDSAFKDYYKESYIIKPSTPRFGSGEAKCLIPKSVRGLDLYVMVDVTNWSITYKLCAASGSSDAGGSFVVSSAFASEPPSSPSAAFSVFFHSKSGNSAAMRSRRHPESAM